jgi:hypothetical protein
LCIHVKVIVLMWRWLILCVCCWLLLLIHCVFSRCACVCHCGRSVFVIVEREACKVVRNDMYVACFVVLGLSCCARHLMVVPLAVCQIMVLLNCGGMLYLVIWFVGALFVFVLLGIDIW